MPIKHVVYATDFSSSCAETLDLVVEMAKPLDARLTVLHVCDEDEVVGVGATEIEGCGRGALTGEAAHNLIAVDMRTLLSHVASDYQQHTCGRIVAGEVDDIILEAAEACQLLVINAYRRSGLQALMLGSVAERLVRSASCPVLTVKPVRGRRFPRAFTIKLKDRSKVLLRPVVAEDKVLIKKVIDGMSRQSRFMRFMAPIRELSEDQLRVLTEIDYRDHMAWIALDLSTEDQVPLGIARYQRADDDARAAEAAVAVVDSHHGRGLGTMMLGVLTRSAATNGLERFRAYVLSQNGPMLRILEDCQAGLVPAAKGALRFELDLPSDPSKLPDTAVGKAFKRMARQMGEPSMVDYLHREVLAGVAQTLSKFFD